MWGGHKTEANTVSVLLEGEKIGRNRYLAEASRSK